MSNRIKVLVLSNTPWDVNNSFGNSYSNIFQGMNLEFANIYCREGQPNNDFHMKSFQITTSDMVMSILNRNYKTGNIIVDKDIDKHKTGDEESSVIRFSKKHRWVLLLWVRELIWRLGKWKSDDLMKFIKEFNPDLLFQPIYGQGYSYLNSIALFLKGFTGCPMLGYVSDDCYSLRQFSLSPFYWIDRLIRRPQLRRLMKSCSIMYVISDTQKDEYEKMLGTPCKVLTKGNQFNNQPTYNPSTDVIHMVYAGNIGEGRWRSLSTIGKILDESNDGKTEVDLTIYTATPITDKMIRSMKYKSIILKAAVPASKLKEIFAKSDILVHVESVKLRERLLVHQSFSTKIVDYLHAGRAVLAYGSMDSASINMLKQRDAAFVATCEGELKNIVHKIRTDTTIISKYAVKSWNCGKTFYQISGIQKMLMEDFETVIKGD